MTITDNVGGEQFGSATVTRSERRSQTGPNHYAKSKGSNKVLHRVLTFVAARKTSKSLSRESRRPLTVQPDFILQQVSRRFRSITADLGLLVRRRFHFFHSRKTFF